MTPEEFKDFMEAQTDAIEVAKWLLGEKLGYDPGPEYVKRWILSHVSRLTSSSVSIAHCTTWNWSTQRTQSGVNSLTHSVIHFAPSPVTLLMLARCSSVSCR